MCYMWSSWEDGDPCGINKIIYLDDFGSVLKPVLTRINPEKCQTYFGDLYNIRPSNTIILLIDIFM